MEIYADPGHKMSVRAASYGGIAHSGRIETDRNREDEAEMRSDDGRETYYVSVGGKEIVKDKGATPWEFEIRANEEELYRLQDLFEELASLEEAEMLHFTWRDGVHGAGVGRNGRCDGADLQSAPRTRDAGDEGVHRADAPDMNERGAACWTLPMRGSEER
jgi:hypothetical protein